MRAVAAADTSLLYPAGDPRYLDVDDDEIERANEIVGKIVRGDLPEVRVITNIQQETFDHIKDDGGIQPLRDRFEAWKSPRIDYRHPSEEVVEMARSLMEQYDHIEFADGALIAYLNSLETNRVAVYTLERKMDGIFRHMGIEPVHTARNPFTP
ncbi:hypothetical protein J2752_000168 [Halarchaeum rubridurum]|uniref:PIN domain-containing protein n=1 Tax=Halarchaeum rubridurum TaxID=489911 RepID=A0A830FNG3_9EURY|nr:hypothetical protein [Halarchaeum rubridurum]MBP1953287.1 hypothetical protein [Halarchaeum rubridurum]GGM66423.1 hypothetical protein GCM10009017_15670 [Halarchaeum rubridurum]